MRTRSAEELLCLSPAAFGARIRRLEQQLGAELFAMKATVSQGKHAAAQLLALLRAAARPRTALLAPARARFLAFTRFARDDEPLQRGRGLGFGLAQRGQSVPRTVLSAIRPRLEPFRHRPDEFDVVLAPDRPPRKSFASLTSSA